MSADVPVFLCTEKDSPDTNPVVHLSRVRRAKSDTIYCEPHPMLEWRRKVYRATGKPGSLNVCKLCAFKAGSHAVYVEAPALKARQPKPDSAQARTVPLWNEGPSR